MAAGGRRHRRRLEGRRPARRGCRRAPRSSPGPTRWPTIAAAGRRVRQRRRRASPGSASRWRRSTPASGSRWPTRSRSSPAGPVVRRVREQPGRRRAGARSTASTAPSTSACARSTPTAQAGEWVSRIVLTASGGPFRGRTQGRAGRRHHRRRPRPSHLVDGPEDHHRLVHADEQGPRGDRGPRAVRRRLRPHRGGRAPAVDRALDGRVHRRRHHGPAVPARHAAARSPTPWPTPSGSARRSAASTGPSSGRLDFEPPDHEAFPCLGLAYEAGRMGETAPAWLNAANEVAVAAFLDGRIAWIAIPDVLTEVLSRHDGGTADERRRRHRRRCSRPGRRPSRDRREVHPVTDTSVRPDRGAPTPPEPRGRGRRLRLEARPAARRRRRPRRASAASAGSSWSPPSS